MNKTVGLSAVWSIEFQSTGALGNTYIGCPHGYVSWEYHSFKCAFDLMKVMV